MSNDSVEVPESQDMGSREQMIRGVYPERPLSVPVQESWTRYLIRISIQSFFTAVALFMALIVIYRWIRYGFKLAIDRVCGVGTDLMSIIDRISPSPDEEIRKEKVEEVKRAFVNNLNALTIWEFLKDSIISLDFLQIVVLITGVTSASVGAYYLMRESRNRVVRLVRQSRGIVFESIKEGSVFFKAEIPKFQVAVMKPGLLKDVHVGFGVRYFDYLVVPTHVLSEADTGEGTLLLSGTKSKVIVPLAPLVSRVHDDLSYLFLTEKTWSLLGTQNPSWVGKHENTHVSCTGLNGSSSGSLRKMKITWMVTYSGSTIPGMSGAAYHSGRKIHGIHTGVAGSYNTGIAASLIRAEMKFICVGEATPDTNDDVPVPRHLQYYNRDPANIPIWRELDAFDDIKDRYQDEWVRGAEVDYDYQLKDWDYDGESRKKKSQKPSFKLSPEGGGIRVEPQAGSSDPSILSVVTTDDLRFLQFLRRSQVPARLNRLENVVASLVSGVKDPRPRPFSPDIQKVSPPPRVTPRPTPAFPTPEPVTESLKNPSEIQPEVQVRYPCRFCSTQCKTEESRSRHEKSHKKNESAVPHDTGVKGKSIKTASFLERRQSSQRKNGKQSSQSSKSLTRSAHSQPQEASQSPLMLSQKSIEQLANALAKALDGRSSATRRN
jgi:hypothetical protein